MKKLLVLSFFLMALAGCDSLRSLNSGSGKGNNPSDTLLSESLAVQELTTQIPILSTPTNYFMGIPSLPDSLDFAGEVVPLDRWEVREALTRELTVLSYWHASMTYILQLSTRYRPVIEPILKKEGVSEDFFYLCVAESSLQPVISPAGAAGFWQFMKGTAKEYHLEVSAGIDQRYHLEKATVAATQFLKKAYAKYGSWTLAAASYNMGTNGMTRAIEQQKEHTYYDLHLPAETMRYLFRILAFKQVMQAPEEYGFTLKESDYFPPLEWQEVTTVGNTDWVQFAKAHHTTYKMLRLYNPWIRDYKLTTNKKYTVKIPKP